MHFSCNEMCVQWLVWSRIKVSNVLFNKHTSIANSFLKSKFWLWLSEQTAGRSLHQAGCPSPVSKRALSQQYQLGKRASNLQAVWLQQILHTLQVSVFLSVNWGCVLLVCTLPRAVLLSSETKWDNWEDTKQQEKAKSPTIRNNNLSGNAFIFFKCI